MLKHRVKSQVDDVLMLRMFSIEVVGVDQFRNSILHSYSLNLFPNWSPPGLRRPQAFKFWPLFFDLIIEREFGQRLPTWLGQFSIQLGDHSWQSVHRRIGDCSLGAIFVSSLASVFATCFLSTWTSSKVARCFRLEVAQEQHTGVSCARATPHRRTSRVLW